MRKSNNPLTVMAFKNSKINDNTNRCCTDIKINHLDIQVN